MKAAARSKAEMNDLLGSRRVDHVVVLGANGAMGYGSGALFTSAAPRVTFLARAKDKAEQGLKAAVQSVRSSTVADRADTGDYDRDFDAAVVEGGHHLRGAHRGLRPQAPDVRARRQAAPARLDRRDRHERPLDQRARRGPQRVVPQALPRAALLQPAERHRRDRAHCGQGDGSEARRVHRRVRAQDARPRDDPHGGHAGLRRQPRRLQGAQRGGAARRGARPRARRAPRRPVHRARADSARDDRSRRLGHPPRDRGQHPQARARRGARDAAAARLHGAPARARGARQQERRRLLQGRGQDQARARSEDRVVPARRRGQAARPGLHRRGRDAAPRRPVSRGDEGLRRGARPVGRARSQGRRRVRQLRVPPRGRGHRDHRRHRRHHGLRLQLGAARASSST